MGEYAQKVIQDALDRSFRKQSTNTFNPQRERLRTLTLRLLPAVYRAVKILAFDQGRPVWRIVIEALAAQYPNVKEFKDIPHSKMEAARDGEMGQTGEWED